MTTKRVEDYELLDHGIENPQYFQGCGTSLTQYDEVVTGIGDSPAEAIDNCLEKIAWAGFDAEELEKRILADEGWDAFPSTPSVSDELNAADEENDDECDMYYHVSIRWK